MSAEHSGSTPETGHAAETPGSDFASEVLRRLAGRGEPFGRYRLEGEIAKGGQGAVLRVWDEDLHRYLAMKVMLGRAQSRGDTPPVDSRSLGRFLEEAQVTSQLDHPGIVPVHELGVDSQGRIYFTMKLVKGEDLKAILEHVKTGEGGWTQTRALGVLLRVCEAMAYAHAKGVIHRDLKPGNVMVGRYGEVYVMDWGLARVLDREDRRDIRIAPQALTAELVSERRERAEETPESPLVTMDGHVVGTPSYMAPEQALGRLEEIGPHSDVYSLGAMLYQLLAEHMPYIRPGMRPSNYAIWYRAQEGPPESLRERAPGAPAALVAICEKAMARDRRARYRDMGELAEDLRAFLEHRVVHAYEEGTLAELRRWVERNRTLAAAIAAGILALLAGLASSLALKVRSDANAVLASDRAREARYQTYLASIRAADAAYRLNESIGLRRALDAAPEEHRNWEWRYLMARSDTSLSVLRGHAGAVNDAAFSPDGARIVTASDDGTARIWDATSGAQLAVLSGHDAGIRSASFSPDGARIVTSSADKTARMWDASTRLELFVLRGHEDQVSDAGFSRDGSLVLTASPDKTVRTWDAATGKQLTVLQEQGAINAAALSPDGSRIVTASSAVELRLWDTSSGAQLAVLQRSEPVGYSAHAVGFSPDGALFVVGYSDGVARIWDTSSAKELAILPGHQSVVCGASFSPDGARILTASVDGTARIWDATSRAPLAVLRGHEGAVNRASFSPDGARIVTASQDGTARIWNAAFETGAAVPKETGVSAAALSPEGARLVTVSFDGAVRLRDEVAGTELALLSERGVESVSFSSDGSRIVTASTDKTARIVDAAAGRELLVLRGHEDEVRQAVFSSDDSRVATASGDGTARIWDSRSGSVLAVLRGHEKGVWGAAFSPDGARVVTASEDATARTWDAATGRPLTVLRGHGASVWAAAFSPDGARIVTASEDVRIWDAESGDQLTVLSGHHNTVFGATFSPDGARIATASADGIARIWDPDNGEELAVLQGHGGWLRSAAFSSDGVRLLTTSSDGTALIWDSAPWALRCQERRESIAREPGARRIVAGLESTCVDLAAAAARIRSDPELEAAMKSAALDMVARKADEAFEWVDHVRARLIFRDDVLAAVREDTGRHTWVREHALRLTLALEDDPGQFNGLAWAIVASADRGAEDYERALRAARSAEAGEPRSSFIVNTLGVAQYRCGLYAEALDTLTRSAALAAQEGTEAPEDLAFLAMARFRLGDVQGARADLARLRPLVNASSGKEQRAFLAEAEALIESP